MRKSCIKIIYEYPDRFNREIKTDYAETHDFEYALHLFASNHFTRPYKILSMQLIDDKLR